MASISHSTANSRGPPINTASATPLARSASHSGQVSLLKPKRASIAEGAVKARREADDESDQAGAGEQGEAVHVAATQPGVQPTVDQAERAAECQGQQDEGVDHDFDKADAYLGRRVIGGLAMIGQVDAARQILPAPDRGARRRDAKCRRSSQRRSAVDATRARRKMSVK